MKSTYGALGIPETVSGVIFVVLFLLALASVLPGIDLGSVKIPDLKDKSRRFFWIVRVLCAASVLCFIPIWGRFDAKRTKAASEAVREFPAASADSMQCDDISMMEILELGPLGKGMNPVRELGIGKVDSFTIETQVGDRLSIEARDDSENQDFEFCAAFVSSEGKTITSSKKPSSLNHLNPRIEVGGVYELRVWSPGGSNGRYALKFRNLITSDIPRIAYEQHKSGKIGGNQEADVFAFEGLKGDRVSLIVHDPDDLDGETQPKVEILATARTPPVMVDEGWGRGTYATNAELPEDGEYRVFVKDRLGRSGSYFICLHELGGDSNGNSTSSLHEGAASYRGRILPMPLAFLTTGMASNSQLGSESMLILVITGRDGMDRVYNAKPGQIITIKSEGSSASLGVRALVRSDFSGANIEISSTGPKSSVVLEKFYLKIGDKYTPKKTRLLRSVELGDIVRGKSLASNQGSVGRCCVSCDGIKTCGCAVEDTCGSCCTGSCCLN